MAISVLLQKMLLLVMLMAVGFVSCRCGLLDSAFTAQLSRFMLNVIVPAMLLSAGISSDLRLGGRELLNVGAGMLFYLLLIFAAARLLTYAVHPKREERGLYRFVGTFSNTVFFGYPLASMVLGDEAVVYAAALSLPFTLLVFSAGPAILNGREEGGNGAGLRRAVNPCTLASVAAVALIVFPVRMPEAVSELLKTLSGATTPLVFVIIGSNLAALKAEQLLRGGRFYLYEVLRRVALPIAVYHLAGLLFSNRTLTGCMAILASVPAASSGILIVESTGEDPRPIAESVFKSTLISVVTIPIVLAILFGTR